MKSDAVTELQDAIVVGGSFAGLSAAMQLVRARRRVLLVDSGAPRNRFAAASHGFLGQDGRSPADIIRIATAQLDQYPELRRLRGEAVDAAPGPQGFVVQLADGFRAVASRLVLATGIRDELPPVPGLRERWGTGVLHCPYCHGYEVAGGPLGVLATSSLALDQALLLADWGPTVLYTQGAFEPSPQQRAAAATRGVRFEPVPIAELLGRAPALDAVLLADGRRTALRALFTAPRTQMASPLAAQLGCAFDDGPLGPTVRVDDWGRTTVEGVYAAGDAASPRHNATLAAASGVLAGIGAHRSLALGSS